MREEQINPTLIDPLYDNDGNEYLHLCMPKPRKKFRMLKWKIKGKRVTKVRSKNE